MTKIIASYIKRVGELLSFKGNLKLDPFAVDNLTQAVNAGNGINVTDSTVKLGGVVSEDTDLDVQNVTLRLNASLPPYPFTAGSGFGNLAVNKVLVMSDQRILVVGDFLTYKGVSASGIVRIFRNGDRDPSFDMGTGFNQPVLDVAVQEDGKIICVGDFTIYNGVSANRIIRLNPDGSRDDSFEVGTGFTSRANCLALQSDGKILVGGAALTYQSNSSKSGAVRLNPDGALDTSFSIPSSGSSGRVLRICIRPDGKILCGGSFSINIQGGNRSRLMLLESDGSVDGSFVIDSGFNSDIYALALQEDGKIVCGGGFTSYKGVSANRIIRLNPDGSRDDSFEIGIGFGDSVHTLYITSEGYILCGGDFTSYSGNNTTRRVARLDPSGGIDLQFRTQGNGFNGQVRSLGMMDDGDIVVGGDFTRYDGSYSYFRFAIIDNSGFRLSFHTNIKQGMLEYGGDYHLVYTKRTLVDKGYVDKKVADSGSVTFYQTHTGALVSGVTKVVEHNQGLENYIIMARDPDNNNNAQTNILRPDPLNPTNAIEVEVFADIPEPGFIIQIVGI